MTADSKLGKKIEELIADYRNKEEDLKASRELLSAANRDYKAARQSLEKEGISPYRKIPNTENKMSFEDFVKQDPDFAYIIKDDVDINNKKESDSAVFLKPAPNGNTLGVKLYKTGIYRFGGIITKSGETKFKYDWQYAEACTIRWFQDKLETILLWCEIVD